MAFFSILSFIFTIGNFQPNSQKYTKLNQELVELNQELVGKGAFQQLHSFLPLRDKNSKITGFFFIPFQLFGELERTERTWKV